MLGLGNTIGIAPPSFLSYVQESLVLYMPTRGVNILKGLEFVGTDSASFDGTNDYVLCGDDTSLDITDDITMMAWVKPASAGQTSHIIGRDDGTNRNYVLHINGSNKFQFDFYVGNSAQSVTSTTADTAGIWVHLACTRHKASGKNIIYVNGVAEDTDTDSTAAIDNDDVQFSIGARDDASSDFRGSIKNVAIWNRAITDTEVQNVMYKSYEEVSGRLLTGMVSWWALEESVVALVTKAADSHGSNTGTITGATVAAAGSGSKYGGVVPTLPRMVDISPKVQADSIGAGSAFFDEDNADYITMGDVAAFSDADGFSIAFWVKFVSLNGNTALITKHADYGDVDNAGEFFIINDDGICEFVVLDHTNSASIGTYTGTVFVAETWTHVACTHDGGTASSGCLVYIDGVLQAHNANATGSGFANINDTAQQFRIGAFADDGEPHDGNICQAGFWSAVLTQAQIQSIMEKTYSELTASETTDLVSYWPLDVDATDSKGSNDGTLT